MVEPPRRQGKCVRGGVGGAALDASDCQAILDKPKRQGIRRFRGRCIALTGKGAEAASPATSVLLEP